MRSRHLVFVLVLIAALAIVVFLVPPRLASAPTEAPTVVEPSPSAAAPVATAAPSPSATTVKIVAQTVPDPGQVLTAIENASRSPRDLCAIFQRLGRDGCSRTGADSAPAPAVGQSETFFVGDNFGRSYFTRTAQLKVANGSAMFYVTDEQPYDERELADAAESFDKNVAPIVEKYFGGSNVTGRLKLPITILNTTLPGVDGYFSSADTYPKSVNPFSNGRLIVYVDPSSAPIGGSRYMALLAHEFEHLVHWTARASDDGWFSEGTAELAMRLAGFPDQGPVGAFMARPGTPLTLWPVDQQSLGNYGAAYLFVSYVAQRLGSYDVLANIVGTDEPTIVPALERIDTALRKSGLSFRQVFADWVAANILDSRQGVPAELTYRDLEVCCPRTEQLSSATFSSTVQQLGTQYLETSNTTGLKIGFQGVPTATVIATTPHSGSFLWWSNRGDMMDNTLTRAFDLRGVGEATLRYWTWFNIERGFDFAYVMASTDNGRTWSVLPATHTTSENEVGNNLGHGYTGSSERAGWVRESVDLTAFAGRQVLIRFEYITDDQATGDGFAVDDVEIPEIGFLDDVEASDGWEARGFVRIANTVPQDYVVQAVTVGSGTAEVVRMSLDTSGKGTLVLAGAGGEPRTVIIAVSALSTVSSAVAPYSVTVKPILGQ